MDKKYGDILMEANRSRPKMALVLRDENGTKIAGGAFNNIRLFTDLLVRQLLDKASADPRVIGAKSLTKSSYKSLFHTEYHQAILTIEAQETALRLCTRHWKAEVMLSQSFLRRGGSNAEDKHGRSIALTTSDENPSQPQERLRAVPIPKLRDMGDAAPAPMNAAPKRALELSPGPKSPSSSHAQKRTKDHTTLPGLKTSSSLVPAGE